MDLTATVAYQGYGENDHKPTIVSYDWYEYDAWMEDESLARGKHLGTGQTLHGAAACGSEGDACEDERRVHGKDHHAVGEVGRPQWQDAQIWPDYVVSAKSGKNVGSYKVTVVGKGSYEGTASATFKIAKAASKLAKTKVSKTLKAKSLKKKAATIKLPMAKFGEVTWKVSQNKTKKVLVLTKDGKVKVKKGAKTGVYTMKLKASVKGTSNYNALKNKVVTVEVKVK